MQFYSLGKLRGRDGYSRPKTAKGYNPLNTRPGRYVLATGAGLLLALGVACSDNNNSSLNDAPTVTTINTTAETNPTQVTEVDSNEATVTSTSILSTQAPEKVPAPENTQDLNPISTTQDPVNQLTQEIEPTQTPELTIDVPTPIGEDPTSQDPIETVDDLVRYMRVCLNSSYDSGNFSCDNWENDIDVKEHQAINDIDGDHIPLVPGKFAISLDGGYGDSTTRFVGNTSENGGSTLVILQDTTGDGTYDKEVFRRSYGNGETIDLILNNEGIDPSNSILLLTEGVNDERINVDYIGESRESVQNPIDEVTPESIPTEVPDKELVRYLGVYTETSLNNGEISLNNFESTELDQNVSVSNIDENHIPLIPNGFAISLFGETDTKTQFVGRTGTGGSPTTLVIKQDTTGDGKYDTTVLEKTFQPDSDVILTLEDEGINTKNPILFYVKSPDGSGRINLDYIGKPVVQSPVQELRDYAEALGINASLLRAHEGQGQIDQFGFSIENIGDIDGDCIDDYAIGSPNEDVNGVSDAGSLKVYSKGKLLWSYEGTIEGQQIGKEISSVTNSSGEKLILIGTPFEDASNELANTGAFFVLDADGNVVFEKHGNEDRATLGFTITGFGNYFAVSSPLAENTEGVKTGKVEIYDTNTFELVDTKYGNRADDFFGHALGVSDNNLIITAPGMESEDNLKDRGAVFQYDSGFNGVGITFGEKDPSRDRGVRIGQGHSVVRLNNGRFAVSSPQINNSIGRVYIFNPDGSIYSTYDGVQEHGLYGESMAKLNIGGVEYIAVGAPKQSSNGLTDNGAVHIINLETGDVGVLEGTINGGKFGYEVTSGNFDNDTDDELAVGAIETPTGTVPIIDISEDELVMLSREEGLKRVLAENPTLKESTYEESYWKQFERKDRLTA